MRYAVQVQSYNNCTFSDIWLAQTVHLQNDVILHWSKSWARFSCLGCMTGIFTTPTYCPCLRGWEAWHFSHSMNSIFTFAYIAVTVNQLQKDWIRVCQILVSCKSNVQTLRTINIFHILTAIWNRFGNMPICGPFETFILWLWYFLLWFTISGNYDFMTIQWAPCLTALI